ncbi:AraC family transcriptional regulator [Paenibacillus sp. ISL-20]|uniref:AraC family transcriptional regulator n=1 Tax=Paenibacillus sp. ISL-20 TaxID=2819163 RepID=UPI001BE57509|nr:AraC family transcriptional regulator [Paenibacillus sp. ISL-20]MBT2760301.1 helix-turn-helix domain-containing protein [Paenibacillus sp. ISL-20]
MSNRDGLPIPPKNYYFKITEFEQSSAVWPVSMGKDESKANSQIGPKIVPYYYMIFVLEGQGEFIYKQKKFALRKSDMFCLFPQIVHEYHVDKDHPLQKVWIAFEGPQALRILEQMGIKSCTPYIENALRDDVLNHIQSLFELANQADQSDFDLSRLIVFHKIIEELSARTSDASRNIVCSDYWLHLGREYMQRHYMDHLNVEQIADYLHVTRAHFTRRFHQEFGVPPAKYLQQLKIKEAKRLLEHTNHNLSIIAQSIGYLDTFTFSKMFKKIAGIPPRDYRLLKKAEGIENP